MEDDHDWFWNGCLHVGTFGFIIFLRMMQDKDVSKDLKDTGIFLLVMFGIPISFYVFNLIRSYQFVIS